MAATSSAATAKRAALMKAEESYPPDVVREYMDGNLCRCTGYEKIWDALQKVLDRKQAGKGSAKSS